MKNMKLTHLSLSVLIALGLVACGGSDNKDNMTIDKDKHGETGGKGGNGGGKPEITPEHTGNIPQRYVPGLNVPDDLKGQVAARKRFVVRRGFADPALGYPDDPAEYDEKVGTTPRNIKKESLYNYVEENDLVVVSGDGKKATGGFTAASKGAISIGLPKVANKFGDDTDHVINAWAKGTDGKYYRLVPNVKAIADYKADTKFRPLEAVKDDAKKAGITLVKQKDVVFIANANLGENVMELDEKGKYILGQADKQKEVVLDNVSAFGNTYNVEKLSQNIDLSQFPVDKTKIQVEDIKAAYRVINTKGTANSDDDKVLRREATLGKFKVYNLPHSIAFVTTNADMSGEKNVFNLDGGREGGKFQLNGFETTSLPKDGRATYTGKSFNATIEGDIELFADFFENEAGISGRVYNRKEKKGDKVEDKVDLALERVQFSDPQSHSTSAFGAGKVKGDSDYANSWTVQLYGADAQEAGGFLGNFTPAQYNGNTKTADAKFDVKEVYTSQRGKLYPKSNDSTTK